MASRRKSQSSVGGVKTDALPESPIFRRPAEAGRRAEAHPTRHMGGKPIPEEVEHLIPYENTDEGIAERDAKPKARASVLSDPLDKARQERRDFRLNSTEPWEAPDPRQDLADKYVAMGMRPHFLSPMKIDKDGMRKWEPVEDENGRQVKLGNMILAQMPEEMAQARDAHYQAIGGRKLAEVHREFREGQERLFRGARGRSKSADGLQVTTGNTEEVLH